MTLSFLNYKKYDESTIKLFKYHPIIILLRGLPTCHESEHYSLSFLAYPVDSFAKKNQQ
jgi:hypothetical protein